MASYGKFQGDNNKYTKKVSRNDTANPSLTAMVKVNGVNESFNFNENLDKWSDLVAFYRFYPDLWYDLITPETNNIHLDLDQRVFMRVLTRFYSAYACFPRGFGKTFIEVMVMIHTSVFYPNMEFVMTAQTRENAAALLQDKYAELIKYYPLIKNEVYSTKFQKDIAEIEFHNGSKIDILANNQSSKGRRRKRIMVEESALLDNKTYEDVLEPIPNVPRRTIGRLGLIDKTEMNGQNHFLSTTGFRGSDEFYRCLTMLEQMKNLEGFFVLGASWELACYYGRGESKAKILAKKEKISPIAFARNYCEKWVGSDTNNLVNPNKLIECRVLGNAETVGDKNGEYILAVDVARSMNSSNCQTSIAVLKKISAKNGNIKSINLVNILTLSGVNDFGSQAVEVKKTRELYNAQVVVVDCNGLGTGLADFLVKESIDLSTGNTLPCFKTLNTERKSESDDCISCLYELNAQSCQNEIVVKFMDAIESTKFKMLEKRQAGDFDINDEMNSKNNILPFIQTDLLVDEILNLKTKQLPNGNLTLEKVVKKMDKDRASATIYGVWYMKKFMDNFCETDDRSNEEYLLSYLNY